MTEIYVEKLLAYMQKRFDEMEEFIKLGLVQNIFRELSDELKSVPTVGHKELYLQLSGKEWRVSDWQAQAINAFVSAGNEVIDVKEIAVYLKPEEHKGYYVINETHTGCFDLSNT